MTGSRLPGRGRSRRCLGAEQMAVSRSGRGHGRRPILCWVRQAMVRAVHVGSGASAFIRAKSGDEGYHRAVIGVSDIVIQVPPLGLTALPAWLSVPITAQGVSLQLRTC